MIAQRALVHGLQIRVAMKASLFASILFATAILPSCAYDEGKGEEDNALDQYDEKADSFRKPTEHGTLLFGVPQSARITEDAGFHAWDFTLGDDANVSLATLLVTDNLDTVMYLYKYDDAAASYGRYLFKNDDADDTTVASALKENLDAGTYRVIVKGFKAQLSGSFQVSANCDGAGCAVSSCDITTFGGLDSDDGDSCGELFSDALSGAPSGGNLVTITLAERCSLPPHVAGAVEGDVPSLVNFR